MWRRKDSWVELEGSAVVVRYSAEKKVSDEQREESNH